MPNAWPELAYRVNLSQLGPHHKAEDNSVPVLPQKISLPWLGLSDRIDQTSKRRSLNRVISIRKVRLPFQGQGQVKMVPKSLASMVKHKSSSPSPQQSHPADKWLSCFLWDLHLHPRSWESPSQAWRGDAPTNNKDHPPLQESMEEHPPKQWIKKQVWFNTDEELGDDPTLSQDQTTFLVGGTAEEQDDAPSPSTPLPVDPPGPPTSEGSLHHPTYLGGAHLKVPAKPSAAQSQSQSWLKEIPDPVNHPSQWILAQMDKVRAHPHWWKEIRARKKFTWGAPPEDTP